MFHRYLTPPNRNEPQLVADTGYLKGGQAKVLSWGLKVQALPGSHPASQDTYDFSTAVHHQESKGFRDGKVVVREVYWNEGDEGVIDFPDERRIGIPATVTRFPLP